MESLSRNSLSSILKVNPQDEHRCLGYAPSYHRRCLNPTNRSSRTAACSFLDRGTHMLEQGESVDALLERLAPLVLCRRYHQNQAGGVASRWKEKVAEYLRAQEARREAEREAEEEETEDSSEDSHEGEEEEEGANERDFNVFFPPGARWSSIVPRFGNRDNRGPRRINLFGGRIGNGSTTVTETVEEVSQDQDSERTETTDSNGESRQNDTQQESTAQLNSRPSTIHVQESYNGVFRRPIEGDCGICILPLCGDEEDPKQADSDSTSDEDSGDDHDESTSDASTESEAESVEIRCLPSRKASDLVWCKARCGINYHRDCLRTWKKTFREKIEKSPTCPTCRAKWKV